VVLPWREPNAATLETPCVSLNKVCFWAFCCCNFSSYLSPPARGGSLEFDDGLVILVRRSKICPCCWVSEIGLATVFSVSHHGGVEKRRHGADLWLQIQWCWSSDTKFRASFSVAIACLPTQLAFWWPSYSPAASPGVSATSRWRPSAEFDAAFSVFPEPSGSVPGADEDGRSLCFICISGDRGPDGFLQLLCRVFYVKCRDLSIFMCLCKVLTTNVPAPLN
jgi:hypothetical protein